MPFQTDNNHNNLGWNFDNTYAKLPEHFYSKIAPDAVAEPSLVIVNHELSQSLGLNLQALSEKECAQLFSGNQLPDGAEPLAQAYAGHQFGYFTHLGDGRAHLLGEQITPAGKRFDIQLKGSGRTPYGRRGDGRAALGPMLREYLVGEAMHALGVPTTRSLAVVVTGEPVYRETVLPGAILARVAASHIRVGTFEYFASHKDPESIQRLADYTIARHFPEVSESSQPYLDLLRAIIEQQARLIVQWMRIGFIHGVMNTDNMALSGETIDYGPCAFMDAYDPATVFSSIDYGGRYAYANQPNIAQWNLARFAETLLPFIDEDINKAVELAEQAVNGFAALYHEQWLAMMRSKLGITGQHEGDETLISNLLEWMHQEGMDYTNTFLALSSEEKPTGGPYDSEAFQDWHQRWLARLEQNPGDRESSLQLMRRHNPAVIPRNHKVEQALEAAADGSLQPFEDLLHALQRPYENRPALQPYQSPPAPSERVYQTFCGT